MSANAVETHIDGQRIDHIIVQSEGEKYIAWRCARREAGSGGQRLGRPLYFNSVEEAQTALKPYNVPIHWMY